MGKQTTEEGETETQSAEYKKLATQYDGLKSWLKALDEWKTLSSKPGRLGIGPRVLASNDPLSGFLPGELGFLVERGQTEWKCGVCVFGPSPANPRVLTARPVEEHRYWEPAMGSAHLSLKTGERFAVELDKATICVGTMRLADIVPQVRIHLDIARSGESKRQHEEIAAWCIAHGIGITDEAKLTQEVPPSNWWFDNTGTTGDVDGCTKCQSGKKVSLLTITSHGDEQGNLRVPTLVPVTILATGKDSGTLMRPFGWALVMDAQSNRLWTVDARSIIDSEPKAQLAKEYIAKVEELNSRRLADRTAALDDAWKKIDKLLAPYVWTPQQKSAKITSSGKAHAQIKRVRGRANAKAGKEAGA